MSFSSIAELEALAAQPDPRTFGRLWQRLLDLTVTDAAFVEMVVDARRSQTDLQALDRLGNLFTAPLELARAAGLVDPELSIDDVLLAQRMAFGIVVTAIDTTNIRDAIDRAFAAGSRLARVGNPE